MSLQAVKFARDSCTGALRCYRCGESAKTPTDAAEHARTVHEATSVQIQASVHEAHVLDLEDALGALHILDAHAEASP